MNLSAAVADLEARQPQRMVPDLDRIRAVADLLDHPERTYRTVHVTGTNGKTTTARLVGRILCAHGLSAGVYTSPHLRRVTERLALCDEEISEEEFAETYHHLVPVLRGVDGRSEEPVTYFETLTALAFLWFADKPVDVGVFEVGMGGEWDATNLVGSEVAVLCPIDLDHPELGSTVEEIAREKSGIIKRGSTVVSAEQHPGALAEIRERAGVLGAPVRREPEDFELTGRDPGVGGQLLRIRGLEAEYGDLFLPLHGTHQAHHAALAVAASEALLGRPLAEDAVREALGGATAPGRLEVVARHPTVVLDGAHNPAGAAGLAAALGETFIWQRLHLVIGCLSTKDVAGIVAPLASRADHAYACANSNPKSLPAAEMAAACESAEIPAHAFPTVAGALDAAGAAAEEGDLILVTGSLYTVADARPRYVED
ncbi:MAG TPA: Mur ligase family protein [Actinomycetota bacterium]|nr:Mur ligase family protein [Actinomycetota bacterium]